MKGNSVVIISRDAYHEKISDFIQNNNFTYIIKRPYNEVPKRTRKHIK
jgi:hypothetical protein